VASAFVVRRITRSGVRYKVNYRLGGREAKVLGAGTFANEDEAIARRDWVRAKIADGSIDQRKAYHNPPSAKDKVVYIAELGGLLKIGVSVNPVARCRNLHAVLLHTELGGPRRERELHRRFAHLRVRGEFFKPGPRGEIRRYIKAPERGQP